MYTFTERGIWVEQIIDLKEVGRVLIKKRRKIINITVACMVLGGAYAFLAPSTYQSTSMLRIKQAQGLSNSVLSSANAYSDSMSRQLMNTDAEILKSRNVVEPVITAIEDPEGTGNAPTYEDFVKTRIETKPYKETELLQVSVTGKSPEQAQEANQLLIDTFLKRLAEISHVEQRTTREFLQKRVVTAKSELEQAENKLQQFQVDNKVYSTADQMKGLTDKITLIDREKAQNQLDLETAQAALGSINEQLGSAGKSIADSATVQAYKGQLADLESRKASYIGKYTDEHPAMKEINQQIEEAKKYAAELGIEVKLASIANTNDIQQVTESLASEVDAIFVPIDNTIASAMATVVKVTDKFKIGVFPSADTMVADGGVLGLGVDQYQIGVETAKVIVEVLNGKKPADTPIVLANEGVIYLNEEKAKELGIEIPENIKAKAQIVK